MKKFLPYGAIFLVCLAVGVGISLLGVPDPVPAIIAFIVMVISLQTLNWSKRKAPELKMRESSWYDGDDD